jgi:hypothetical protein
MVLNPELSTMYIISRRFWLQKHFCVFLIAVHFVFLIVKKNTWRTLEKHFLAEFRSFQFHSDLGMGYSETHGIPRKEHFFPRNNKNRSESISRNFFGMEKNSIATIFPMSKPEALYSYSWKIQLMMLIPGNRVTVPLMQCCGTVTIFYGSGSGSDFWKVMVPVPTFEKLWFRFRFQLHI